MSRRIVILEQFASEDRVAPWDNAQAEFGEDYSFERVSTLDEIRAFADSVGSAPRPYVIFAHDSDLNTVQKRGKLISACANGKIPLVLYSGRSDDHRLAALLLEEIKHSTLAENLRSFLSHAKTLTSLSTDDLGRLIDIDPKLELLLGNFEATSPFKMHPNLSSAKEELRQRVSQLTRGRK